MVLLGRVEVQVIALGFVLGERWDGSQVANGDGWKKSLLKGRSADTCVTRMTLEACVDGRR